MPNPLAYQKHYKPDHFSLLPPPNFQHVDVLLTPSRVISSPVSKLGSAPWMSSCSPLLNVHIPTSVTVLPGPHPGELSLSRMQSLRACRWVLWKRLSLDHLVGVAVYSSHCKLDTISDQSFKSSSIKPSLTLAFSYTHLPTLPRWAQAYSFLFSRLHFI